MRSLRLACLVALWLAACGDATAPSPFDPLDAAGAGGVGGEGGAGAQASLGGRMGTGGGANEWGGVCQDDEQCDDGIECTDDTCDPMLRRCRFSPVDARCDNQVFCDGVEQCAPGIGCRPGGAFACDDMTTCTIDRCIEETRSCERTLRDADGDGEGVWNCGGSDCDDDDPRVHGGVQEVCGNQRDDDCDGSTDEDDCTSPAHDTCADAFLVEAAGTYVLSLAGAAEDFGLSCVRSEATRRDVVVAVQVPEGDEPTDVDLVVSSTSPGLAIATASSCTRKASELSCAESVQLEDGRYVARTGLRGVGAGTYPVYLSGTDESEIELRARYAAAAPTLQNETCGTAETITAGQRVAVQLAGAARDLESACSAPSAELVYRLEIERASDLVISAVPLDDLGLPTLSLRSEACVELAAELDCRIGAPARIFKRAIEPGVYFIAVGASGPADVELTVDLRSASSPEPGESCATAPNLEPGAGELIDLLNGTNSVASSCAPGSLDATRTLHLQGSSDVLLVERLSSGDIGGLALLDAACEPKQPWVCEASSESPLRARAFNLAAGEYKVVAESSQGSPIVLSAFVREAAPATLVAFSDTCDEALSIPETGGRFLGSTANASADYDAGCDFGGTRPGGAPEQILRLDLSERRRVVFDLHGSDYRTVLAVRRANNCPGEELPQGCSPGRSESRSFLDLELEAGEYFVQIDGYAEAAGHWVLDVYSTPLE